MSIYLPVLFLAAQCAAVSEVGAVVGKLSFGAVSDHLLSKKLVREKSQNRISSLMSLLPQLIRKGLCPRAPVLLVLTVLFSLSTHLYSYFISQDSTKVSQSVCTGFVCLLLFPAVALCGQLWLMVVLFVFGFSTGGMLGMCSLSVMESVPPVLSATSLGVGDCLTHLGQ